MGVIDLLLEQQNTRREKREIKMCHAEPTLKTSHPMYGTQVQWVYIEQDLCTGLFYCLLCVQFLY